MIGQLRLRADAPEVLLDEALVDRRAVSSDEGPRGNRSPSLCHCERLPLFRQPVLDRAEPRACIALPTLAALRRRRFRDRHRGVVAELALGPQLPLARGYGDEVVELETCQLAESKPGEETDLIETRQGGLLARRRQESVDLIDSERLRFRIGTLPQSPEALPQCRV